MKLTLFAIHDVKAECFSKPFLEPLDAIAVRAFTDCVNSDNHQFGANPQDYTLFKLGEYDDSKGMFETYAPKSLGNGVEFAQAFLRNPLNQVPKNGEEKQVPHDSQFQQGSKS